MRLRTVACAALAGLLAVVAVAAFGTRRSGAAAPRPNVLVVVTDDQRVETMDSMPRTYAWFADTGVSYPNAYVSAPECCPSRASIFTGQYVHNHGVLRNSEGRQLEQATTLQRYLRDDGYYTGVFGKYLNSWDLSRRPPHFDRWSIFLKGHRNVEVNDQGRLRVVERYSTDFLRDHAVGFLDRWRARAAGRPFFLYVAPFVPHAPYTPAKRHRAAAVPPFEPTPAVLEGDRSDKPSYVRQRRPDPETDSVVIPREQKRMVLSADDLVDRVLTSLQESGDLDDTIVIVTADNGYLWGEHGLIKKSRPYPPSVRVPLLVRWPNGIPGGTSDERYASNVDIAPTILDAAGIPAPGHHDGRSLLDPTWQRDHVFSEVFSEDAGTWAAVLTPTEHYVEYYAPDLTTVLEREYYDLVSDPWELENGFANGGAPEVERLEGLLDAARSCAGASCP